MQIILASKSPRRKELMALVTQNFIVKTANVDENIVGYLPSELAQKLAHIKAEIVFAANTSSVVIGCDTVVDLDGVPLGKPKNEKQAYKMLSALSGRRHFVHTGVCMFIPGKETPTVLFTESSAVTFARVSGQEIKNYISSGDPFDKAGAYGVQSGAAKFITRIEGCYFNVVGLPVAALYAALKTHCEHIL